MKVEFKKLYKGSILPKKAHESDAGMDLYAHSFMTCMGPTMVALDSRITEQLIAPGARILVKCGFGMALPVGYEAQVRPRSGLALKHGITVVNSPGTIDANFRNEVGVILMNTGHNAFRVSTGDRIAQMVIQQLPDVEIVEVDALSDSSERGMAGFGSSGR